MSATRRGRLKLVDDEPMSVRRRQMERGQTFGVGGVDGHTEAEDEAHRAELAVLGRGEERAVVVASFDGPRGQLRHSGFVRAEARGAERIGGRQRGGRGPVTEEQRGDRGLPRELRVLEVRALVVMVPPVRRGAVREEQRDATHEALLHRLSEEVIEDASRVVLGPIGGLLRPEAARKEVREPRVVAEEMGVVERL